MVKGSEEEQGGGNMGVAGLGMTAGWWWRWIFAYSPVIGVRASGGRKFCGKCGGRGGGRNQSKVGLIENSEWMTFRSCWNMNLLNL